MKNNQPEIELRKTFSFEAAHRLPKLSDSHKCSRLHGHSFKVTVILRGEVHPDYGWLVDYKEISNAVKPLLEVLDHSYLNEIQGLENPTSEVLAKFIYEKVKATLPQTFQIIISETCTTECRYPV